MGNLGKECKRFTVVEGGLKRLPRFLVMDFDVAVVQSPLRISPDEAQALARVHAAGVELAVVTRRDERDALSAFAGIGLSVAVLPDGPLRGDFDRACARLEHLSALCRKRGIPLRDVAVIASRPCDCPMLLEVGSAIALETAGYDASIAADAVFPARDQGGLAAAINAAVNGAYPFGRG